MAAPTDAETEAFCRVYTTIPGHNLAQHTRFHGRCFPPGCATDSATTESSAVLAMTELQGRSGATEDDRIAVCLVIARDWQTARTLAVLASSAAVGAAEHAAAN